VRLHIASNPWMPESVLSARGKLWPTFRRIESLSKLRAFLSEVQSRSGNMLHQVIISAAGALMVFLLFSLAVSN
jgi:hypothetical protein